MSYPISVKSPQGDLHFQHDPSSDKPLRLDGAPTETDHLLGYFLEEVWNYHPVELLDAIADATNQKNRWNQWSLKHRSKGYWELRIFNQMLKIPDQTLRDTLDDLALNCLAVRHMDPQASESESNAIEHRLLRIWHNYFGK